MGNWGGLSRLTGTRVADGPGRPPNRLSWGVTGTASNPEVPDAPITGPSLPRPSGAPGGPATSNSGVCARAYDDSASRTFSAASTARRRPTRRIEIDDFMPDDLLSSDQTTLADFPAPLRRARSGSVPDGTT